MRDRDFGWTEEVWMDRVRVIRVMLGFGLRTSYVMFFYCHYGTTGTVQVKYRYKYQVLIRSSYFHNKRTINKKQSVNPFFQFIRSYFVNYPW